MFENQANSLHMVQLWFDIRRLVELARALHLPIHRVDHNYITHCAMKELFGGENCPGPFCVEDNNGKYLRVLAYAQEDSNFLNSAAQKVASPMVYRICDWDRMASKPFPNKFESGEKFKFKIRVCPVVRKSSAGKYHNSGTEIDVFVDRVWEIDDVNVCVNREEVYRNWFAERLKQSNAAIPLLTRMERFSIERMARRTSGNSRKCVNIKRPDVTLAGQIEVKDPEKFMQLLKSGIGRHKSFGYGMLKIRSMQQVPYKC